MDSHCEILFDDNYGAGLGRHPTSNYSAEANDAEKQAIIAQQRLRSKILGIWSKNLLTNYDRRKLRAFKYAYNFNTQDEGSTMFSAIVKMV